MAKYKTLMGTPTNNPPSKERQYHIDAHQKALNKKKFFNSAKRLMSPQQKLKYMQKNDM